uniref:Septum formation protein Maf putative n=1 Tax=Albugo laibachii Nc14 TaxID=890382 RepID=F0W2X9_9STRA|nr:septum formation protein Maf putative [Albugo laibachii Nc14]|eukprot:CCA15416.1 septum formation protein Maf putative [Albugo laibachii Nc14]
MMQSVARLTATRRFILASQSPRRYDLLHDCGLHPEVIPSRFEENLDKSAFRMPELYAMETANNKAKCVFADISRKEPERPIIVVGCDTIVVVDNQVLEKPQNEEEAVKMLQLLSNKTHFVHSAVAIYTSVRGIGSPHIFSEKTLVTFQDLSLHAIKAYVATGEPMDKAGAYGIQGLPLVIRKMELVSYLQWNQDEQVASWPVSRDV